jgi:holo-[acyl-carrier protein] synthase
MIFGIGCDITRIVRFEKWVKNPDIIERYFNEKERTPGSSMSEHRMCEWYAVRFAAKEAFSKALGTGLQGFALTDIYIVKTESGRPELKVTGKALSLLKSMCGPAASVFVSLSHEKEYAVATVVIER